jgi:P-type Ca2+ transporter type 2C
MYYNKIVNAYLETAQAVALELQTDLKNGLALGEIKIRTQKYGPNVLKEKRGINPLVLFFSEFSDFLVLILIAAAVVSFFLGEKVDAFMIIAIVLINGLVGFIQEYRVEKAMQQLKKLVTSTTKVYREGSITQIPSSELVPGDLVVLEEGQKVPADIRIIQSYNLNTSEAALTGESTPVTKIIDPLQGELPVGDQKNMVFSGTIITAGEGLGIVINTGMNTEIGKIAKLVSSEVDPITPMQQKLDRLGAFIGKIVLVIATIVALEEYFFGQQKLIESLISAVALAVAAIPEGLPAVVTISLALGTRRLLKQKALIRNLPAAETLGSTDIICCDKTGTLTEGIMSVRKFYLDGQILDIEKIKTLETAMKRLLEMGILSSNARQSHDSTGSKIIGDTTEAALIQVATDRGVEQKELDNLYPRVLQVPFSSDRKMMTVVTQNQNQSFVVSKGATEAILNKCSQIELNGRIIQLTDTEKEQILAANEKMASQALRVLAFAYKTSSVIPAQAGIQKNGSPQPKSGMTNEEIEEDLIFFGLQGMMDPPRVEVKQAINICQNQAGIRVVMITGDHLLTAQAVAKEIGINGKSISGVELDKLSDEEFQSEVESISVYARVSPEHKIRIVKALKLLNHQVAMTGDGVNDAPALKAADIGIAMGITGTDVAKESSDMLLLDDKFNTIVEAVREGRAIYENIRKFVNYLLSSNIMEVLVIFIAVMIGWPLPLLPIHLLWINLVTDGLPAIALGVDPGRADIMSSKPQGFREQIITVKFLRTMFLISTMITIAILSLFGFNKEDLMHAQTMVFTAVVVYELVRIIAIRSEYHLPLFSNKYLWLAMLTSLILQLLVLYLPISIAGNTLQDLFKVVPLSLFDWLIIGGVGIILLMLMKFMVNLTSRTTLTPRSKLS